MAIDSYTKLLLHCDGADGSTTFIDSATGKAVTASGDTQIDTAQSKFGGASALFDGTGDYLSTPDSDDWNFGTGDFTIDFWANFNSIADHLGFFEQYFDANNAIFFYRHTNGNVQIYGLVGGVYKAGYYFAWTPSTGTWYHLALVRNGTNFYIFINGVAQTLTVATAIESNVTPDIATPLNIGMARGGPTTAYFNGWIDEFRVSKSIARWTSNFTPPTKAYGFIPGGFSGFSPYIF